MVTGKRSYTMRLLEWEYYLMMLDILLIKWSRPWRMEACAYGMLLGVTIGKAGS
jgi:hypothetical protein